MFKGVNILRLRLGLAFPADSHTDPAEGLDYLCRADLGCGAACLDICLLAVIHVNIPDKDTVFIRRVDL